MVEADPHIGTVDDASFRRWLAFHDTHTRLDTGYEYVFTTEQLTEMVACHDAHGFAVVKDILTDEQVREMRAEIDEKGACQPSIERYVTQQRLLANPRWMAVSDALLDVGPGEEAMGLTCHHSAVLVRERGTPRGDLAVAWHTDSHAVPIPLPAAPTTTTHPPTPGVCGAGDAAGAAGAGRRLDQLQRHAARPRHVVLSQRRSPTPRRAVSPNTPPCW